MANPRVWWLSGNVHDRTTKLEALKASFKEQFPDGDIHTYGGDITYAYLEHQILSTYCFSDHKLVIVRELPQFATVKQTMINNFEKLIAKLPSDTVLVFDGIDPDDAPKLAKAVSKDGNYHHFTTVLNRDETGIHWVVAMTAEYGKVIEYDAAALLVESCGYDSNLKGIGVDQVRLAIRKLCYFVGKRKNISKDDVVITAYQSHEFVYQHIIDSLNSRNLDRCLTMFHKLVLEQDDVESSVRILLNAALNHYKLLFILKEGNAKKLHHSVLNSEVASLLKLTASGQGFKRKMTVATNDSDGQPKPLYANWLVGKANQCLELYSRRDLGRIIGCVQDCFIGLEHSRSDAALSLLVDLLFMTICTPVDEALLREARNYESSEI